MLSYDPVTLYFFLIREEARELELQAKSKTDISAIHIPKDIKKYCLWKYALDVLWRHQTNKQLPISSSVY